MARKYRRITYEDRKRIEFLYKNKEPIQCIADMIGVSRPTIYRELERGFDADRNYSAETAQKKM